MNKNLNFTWLTSIEMNGDYPVTIAFLEK